MKIELLPDGSPHCPLVRLFAFTPDEAERLRAACRGLADGSIERFSLTDQPWVDSSSPRFAFVADRRDAGFVEEGAAHSWAVRPETWDNIEGLIEPFAQGARRGFQWLDRRGGGSLLFSIDGLW